MDAPDLGTTILGQLANALLQVDDAPLTNIAPLYKLVMTSAEVTQLGQIFSIDNSGLSIDAEMNATFISVESGSPDHHTNSATVAGSGNALASLLLAAGPCPAKLTIRPARPGASRQYKTRSLECNKTCR
jgi:hypothetical protein